MSVSCATHAFSRRPLSRAFRPFIEPAWKVGSGSKAADRAVSMWCPATSICSGCLRQPDRHATNFAASIFPLAGFKATRLAAPSDAPGGGAESTVIGGRNVRRPSSDRSRLANPGVCGGRGIPPNADQGERPAELVDAGPWDQGAMCPRICPAVPAECVTPCTTKRVPPWTRTPAPVSWVERCQLLLMA